MTLLCRSCLILAEAPDDAPCSRCGADAVVRHAELARLAVAHLDCDAFYASVEKRDDPALADRPVLVGGRGRGVVMAACYVARRFGARSAMPMFRALALCPDAVVIRPDVEKYAAVAREVRALMRAVTPLVEPVSIDEAFLDLSGTERLHGAAPALTLARLQRRIADEVGIPVSIGLSHNKFLAKIASQHGKPNGFAVIGRADATDFLGPQPVGVLLGVGPALERRLAADGIRSVGDLQARPEGELARRYGTAGRRLAAFARGEDSRPVRPGGGRKSLSAETTFAADLGEPEALRDRLWPLCETVSRRLKEEGIGGRTVTLKLKTADFRLRTRALGLPHPTQLAETIFRAGRLLLDREADGTRYRLIGIGLGGFAPAADCDPPDLADPGALARARVERTIDALRDRFGRAAIAKGRVLGREPRPGRR